MTADLCGRYSTPYQWMQALNRAIPLFFFLVGLSFWAQVCVTRTAHFYVPAMASLQCAEACESSFATIPILLGWTASWTRTVLSKFDFPQISPITKKCFPQAFPGTFFLSQSTFNKKAEKAWFLETILSVSSWGGKVIGERCVELCSFKKNGIFPLWMATRVVFRASHSDKTTFWFWL